MRERPSGGMHSTTARPAQSSTCGRVRRGSVACGGKRYAVCVRGIRRPLELGEFLKRTAKETSEDDCLGLEAQLAY
jgi:hypothetical protein